MNRWRDWWAQAQRDLDHAEHAHADGDFEWAAFASHQAAEKGLKALILAASGEPWGHSLALLVEALPASAAIGQEVSEAAHRLDKHYIPARYPNGLAADIPVSSTPRMKPGKPSLMRARSSTPAGAVYLDRDLRISQLRTAAERARGRLPALRRAVLFGSLADGTAGPRSDADLLLVLETSLHADPTDRVPEALAALSPLPCPLDLFVVTAAELARLEAAGDPLVREVRRCGLDLLDSALDES
ncbi:MAG TPA: HEPN domain-containing protein [Thermoanaerobaculia bacterium]|nr:HEPN domain-containing protein [Thermoanaerobaculia bacterium]